MCVNYEQLLLFEIKTHELYVYSGGDVVDLGRASCLIRGRGATTEPTVNWDHAHVFSSPTFPHQALEGVLTAREVRLASRSRLNHLLSTVKEPALGNIYLISVSNNNIGFTSSFHSSFLCLSHFL